MKPVPDTPYMLPDMERHLISIHKRSGRRFWDGYQHNRIDKALEYFAKGGQGVDCGANVGAVAIKMVDAVDELHCIEPASDAFECLAHNMKVHPTETAVVLHHAAVGDVCGMARMNMEPTTRMGDRQLCKEHQPGTEIEMITIDSLDLDDCRLIKMDIQGYELKALKGAALTISRCHPVIILETEAHSKLPNLWNDSDAPLGWLAKRGYREVATFGVDHVMVK